MTIQYGELQLDEQLAPLWLVLTNAVEDQSSLEIVRGDFRASYPDESAHHHRGRIAAAVAELAKCGLIELNQPSGSPVTCGTPLSSSDFEVFDGLSIYRTDEGFRLWQAGPESLARHLKLIAV